LLVKLFDDDLQATLKKLQSQLLLQEQLAKRQLELLKVNGISQNEYDQTLLQINAIKADIEIEKTRIRKTEVLAPFDGVIGLRNISVGAIVTPATMLATIRSSDKLKLDFYVPEKYGYEIKQGMKVNFSLYNSDKPYTATVFATEKNIDNSTRNLKVRALVNSRSAELISGAFANVVLQLNETKGALLIPTQAVIPNEEQKNVIVARNGKAHFAEVKTGIRQASKIEIVSGINAGDTIITTGILFLSEGKPLKYSTVTH
jgi:membrane fusion protein (multidrug efflux system)